MILIYKIKEFEKKNECKKQIRELIVSTQGNDIKNPSNNTRMLCS